MYTRKTPKNTAYFDNEKGRLERIDNVTWITTKCAQCNIKISRKMPKSRFEKSLYFYCSTDCQNEAQRSGKIKEAKEKHFIEKYGVNNPYGAREIIERRKQIMLDRYGVDNPSKIPEIAKAKSIYMKRLYAETDIIERTKQTNLKRYGVTSFLATPEAREFLKKHSLETYGVENHMQSEVFKEEKRKAYFEANGVDNPMQLESVKKKAQQTCLEKYGVDNVFKRQDVIDNRIAKLIENAKRFSSDAEDKIYEQLSQHFDNVIRHVPMLYKRNAFWVIDFKIGNVWIQFDGKYWHGIEKDVATLEKLLENGDKSASMQLKAKRRDARQNSWFHKRNIKLFRITEGTPVDAWLPALKDLIDTA